jgi:hypothetical protein
MDDNYEPERIRTPDGREFEIKELLRQSNKDVRRHNLLNGRTHPARRMTSLKYSIEERRWQATASAEEIMERYGLKRYQATSMNWQARTIIERIDKG